MNKEIQDILDHSIEYAKNLLDNTKECYPFGAFTDTVNQVHPLEFDVDVKNIPNNGKVIEALENFCKEELSDNKITAYGLTYEVALQLAENADPTDAIAIDIHHATEKEIPLYYLPFTVEGDKVIYDQIFAVKR